MTFLKNFGKILVLFLVLYFFYAYTHTIIASLGGVAHENFYHKFLYLISLSAIFFPISSLPSGKRWKGIMDIAIFQVMMIVAVGLVASYLVYIIQYFLFNLTTSIIFLFSANFGIFLVVYLITRRKILSYFHSDSLYARH